MKDQIESDLSSKIEPEVVGNLINAYQSLVARHRSGNLEGALTMAGRFVEHVLRAIESIRTGRAPSEIKSVNANIKFLENQTQLPEPLRILIPRVLYGMIYNLRSKRDAVHVKEIDPTPIDVSLAVMSASWVMAELLRLYHASDDRTIAAAMNVLMRTAIPFVEAINGDTFVSQKVSAETEVLLLLAHAGPDGLVRTSVGNSAKCSQPSVTRALQKLSGASLRYVHRSANGTYYITSAGEQALATALEKCL
ncbi:MAG: hypothetical protein RLP16_05420 [Alphaproteobacteria bacterium]